MSDSKTDLTAPSDEAFLTRWSRRKQLAKADFKDAGNDISAAQRIAEAKQQANDAIAENDMPGDSDMPPIESLDEDSDYSGFMSPNVSDELRNLALRKLFRGGAFNERDGLDDYDDDFTSFQKLGDVITAEMRHQMARIKDAMGDDDSNEVLLDSDNDEPSDEIEPANALETGADIAENNLANEAVTDINNDDSMTADKQTADKQAPEQKVHG
jgi:hypothetical protein